MSADLRSGAIVFLIGLLSNGAVSQEIGNFLVAPIETDLHRAEVSSSDAYAIVNCSSLFVEGKLELNRLPPEKFQTALRDMAKGRESLRIICRYKFPLQVDQASQYDLKQKLVEIGKAAGFAIVTTNTRRTSAKWEDDFVTAESFQEPANHDEPVVENEYVRAFPIRTKLSIFEVGDFDCMVEILRPIDGRMKSLPPELRTAISSAVDGLKLDKRKTLKFSLSSTVSGRDLVESLFNSRLPPVRPANLPPALIDFFNRQEANYTPSEALNLVLDLGFESFQYSHSPGRGQPEEMIGQMAPEFELERLGGDNLSLKRFTKDRPALVTFWGVACGPCCREAPHLSRFHQKYGKDFAILAVNAYDEDREVVKKFADRTQLTHPIVLKGREVSRRYSVGSFPTTFWIGKDGKIDDYDVGFVSSERVEERISNEVGN